MLNRLETATRDALICELRASPRSGYRTIAARLSISQNTVIGWNKRITEDRCTCGRSIHLGECPDSHAVATPEVKAAMIAERLATDASTVKIAEMFNVHPQTVYKALEGYPVRIRHRLPDAHTWSVAQEDRLRAMWPAATWEEMVSAFPDRSRSSIGRKASELGAVRHPDLRIRTLKGGVHPVVSQLRDERQRRRVTVDVLSDECGVNRHSLIGYELGNACPSLSSVTEWARALGFELTLTPSKHRPRRVEPEYVLSTVSLPSQRAVAEQRPVLPVSDTPARRPIAARVRFTAGLPPPVVRPQPSSEVVSLSRRREQDEIERFLRERGATKLPGVGDPEIAALPELVLDRRTHKYTRRPDAERLGYGGRRV